MSGRPSPSNQKRRIPSKEPSNSSLWSGESRIPEPRFQDTQAYGEKTIHRRKGKTNLFQQCPETPRPQVFDSSGLTPSKTLPRREEEAPAKVTALVEPSSRREKQGSRSRTPRQAFEGRFSEREYQQHLERLDEHRARFGEGTFVRRGLSSVAAEEAGRRESEEKMKRLDQVDREMNERLKAWRAMGFDLVSGARPDM